MLLYGFSKFDMFLWPGYYMLLLLLCGVYMYTFLSGSHLIKYWWFDHVIHFQNPMFMLLRFAVLVGLAQLFFSLWWQIVLTAEEIEICGVSSVIFLSVIQMLQKTGFELFCGRWGFLIVLWMGTYWMNASLLFWMLHPYRWVVGLPSPHWKECLVFEFCHRI